MPDVASTHKDYKRMLPDWTMIQDVLMGTSRVKEMKTIYLPMPNKSDQSQSNKDRYEMYLYRAIFFEATSRTLSGLIGEVFAKPPTVELPTRLKLYEPNIDGSGTTLTQQSQQALRYVLGSGRAGVLADYPAAKKSKDGQPQESVATIADLESGEIRPTLLLYGPRDILNWGTGNFGALNKLNFVVLEETIETSVNSFEITEEKAYRVLRLSEAGDYFVEIWKKGKSGTGDYVMEDSAIPKDSAGKPFRHIPFHFMGSVDNTHNVDPAPLAGLARINLGHYCNSADYEYSTYTVGMPTAVMTGLTQQWIDENYPKKEIAIGSSVVLMLPVGGDFKFAAPTENTMAKEAMEHKEQQMVALGAQLVEQNGTEQTATEAGINRASDTSVLGTSTQNVSTAYSEALTDANRFIDAGTKPIEFKLNNDFQIIRMSAGDRAQLLSEWQNKGITTTEYRDRMLEAGLASLPMDQYQDELEQDALNDPMRDPLSQLNVDPLTGLPKVVKEEMTPEEKAEFEKRQEEERLAAKGKKGKKPPTK